METNAIYMTGNGRIAAAYRGGDIIQLFGPPYSSPSLFASCFLNQTIHRGSAKHQPDSAIWQTELWDDFGVKACITDFAVAEEPCLMRHIDSTGPIGIRIHPYENNDALFDYAVPQSDKPFFCFLLKTKNGNAAYNDYPLPFPQFYMLAVRGDAEAVRTAAYTFDITVNGKADILLIGGPSYPECMEASERLLTHSYDALLIQTGAWWQNIFEHVTVRENISKDVPHRQKILQAIEDTVITIVTQQGEQGGVLAGYVYHMGYVRDQFGVCMAMLKLGLAERAKKMLHFYIDVFRRSGKILNAQAMGVDGMFHFAENDASEITGYLLLQFFRYAEITGDHNILLENVDFLQWLYDMQLSQLHNGTLPFNGDETYIAGGLLPRDVINDGSAEATLLFLLSGEAFADFLEKFQLCEADISAKMRETLKKVKEEYTNHFVVNGVYTLNDPGRTVGMELPKYRYGVCMNLGKENCEFFGWTQLCDGEVYLCPKCRSRNDLPLKRNELFHIPSALLMPAYLNTNIVDGSLVKQYLCRLTAELERDGHIYSDQEKKKNVGYDYGLLLYNLVVHGLPGKERVCEKLLSLADEAGAWSEYYIEDRHSGNRYRPWESGINVDALITYALSV